MRVYSEAVEARARALLYEQLCLVSLTEDNGHGRVIRAVERDQGKPVTPAFISWMRGRSELAVATLQRAESFWVSADIWASIVQSSASLPGSFTLEARQLPAQCGWLWLDRPWALYGDAFARRTWPDSAPAIAAISWAYARSAPDGPEGLVINAYHKSERAPYPHVAQAFESWFLSETLDQACAEAVDTTYGGSIVRALLAAFLWLEQTICVAVPTTLERHAAKRLRHSRIEKALKVVVLRRADHQPAPPAGAPQPVEWSCQWLVRGHWRQQFYSSDNKHSPRWIAPYVKGPEDKPLKPSSTVFAVTR